MLNTTTDLKNLSKKVKTQFTFSKIASFLNKIVKKDSFKEMLATVIGQKSDETIKNGQANEIVASLFGSRDFNELIATTQKNESLSKNEIVSGIETILKTLNNESSYYEQSHNIGVVHQNLTNYYNDCMGGLLESLPDMQEDAKSGQDYAKRTLAMFNIIKCIHGQKVVKIEVSSYTESNRCEISMVLDFENEDKIDIDAVLHLCLVDNSIEYVESENTKVNDISLNLMSEYYDDFIIGILGGFTESNIVPHKEKEFSSEEMKKLSVLVSNFTK